MNREQLVDRVDRAWAEFVRSYAGLEEKELSEPGVTGSWSVKDIISHVTTWEEEALRHLPSIAKGGAPPKYSAAHGGIDAFNAKTAEKNRKLSLTEVIAKQERTHDRLISYLRRVSEGHFSTETRFRRRLRLDTYGHYPKHAAAIRRWRKGRDDRMRLPD